jgi:hypothetical protein
MRMPKFEIELPFKVNANTILLLVQLIGVTSGAVWLASTFYAEQRQDRATIARLQIEIIELRAQASASTTASRDAQEKTGNRLAVLETQQSFIIAQLMRIERSVSPR